MSAQGNSIDLRQLHCQSRFAAISVVVVDADAVMEAGEVYEPLLFAKNSHAKILPRPQVTISQHRGGGRSRIDSEVGHAVKSNSRFQGGTIVLIIGLGECWTEADPTLGEAL